MPSPQALRHWVLCAECSFQKVLCIMLPRLFKTLMLMSGQDKATLIMWEKYSWEFSESRGACKDQVEMRLSSPFLPCCLGPLLPCHVTVPGLEQPRFCLPQCWVRA